jgi:hypothetical protein
MKDIQMKDEIAGTIYAKAYTDWHIKTGGFARDMTMRDYIAVKAMQERVHDGWDDEELARLGYQTADAVLKERAK